MPTESPRSKISTQGKNLTGNARHLRDLTADIHSNLQQWNNACLRGTNLIKLIAQEKHSEKYSLRLEELCDQLEDVVDILDNVVDNLNLQTRQIKTIMKLCKPEEKLFSTWPPTKFDHLIESIYDIYHREAKIKRRILENVAHDWTESWKMLHLATWAREPMIPESFTKQFESMLVETEHR